MKHKIIWTMVFLLIMSIATAQVLTIYLNYDTKDKTVSFSFPDNVMVVSELCNSPIVIDALKETRRVTDQKTADEQYDFFYMACIDESARDEEFYQIMEAMYNMDLRPKPGVIGL